MMSHTLESSIILFLRAPARSPACTTHAIQRTFCSPHHRNSRLVLIHHRCVRDEAWYAHPKNAVRPVGASCVMNLESASSAVSRSLKMRKTESEADDERPSCSTTDVANSADLTEPKAYRAQRLRTVALINLAAVMERMDEQVWLPARLPSPLCM